MIKTLPQSKTAILRMIHEFHPIFPVAKKYSRLPG